MAEDLQTIVTEKTQATIQSELNPHFMQIKDVLKKYGVSIESRKFLFDKSELGIDEILNKIALDSCEEAVPAIVERLIQQAKP